MKCPICGDTLTPSKKNPDYVLCHNCRKKFRLPKKRKAAPAHTAPVTQEDPADSEEAADKTQVYSREEVQAALRKLDEEKRARRSASREASARAKTASRRPAPEPEYDDDDDVEFHFRYANIPPKEVREKQEREMRKAYDELLSIGKEEKEKKRHGFFRRRK